MKVSGWIVPEKKPIQEGYQPKPGRHTEAGYQPKPIHVGPKTPIGKPGIKPPQK